ncbi:ABC transporter permease [Clostridium sp. D2Q-14]|uniref:ABC transporter permease n=1 Tax=Anaeromonas gelatinilytica TaxID=2683194 RepID=UPI00193B5043|nr:ABC transporter permease [Anaeromonas gelatinilytica]MBS4536766.1 ABC transporter permease [Anaeromonas gelatinilytica]
MNVEKRFEIVRTFVAVTISLLIGFAIILFASDEPLSTLYYFIISPSTKMRYLGNVVELAIPLIFSGLATSILFQTGLFNLGSEGVFYFSGLLASIIGIKFSLSFIFHPILAILIGSLFGMIVMLLIGFFKAKWNASELVISLMFNSIFFGIGAYILNFYFRDPNVSGVYSFKMNESVFLNKIIPGTRIHTGLIIALLTVFLVYLFLYRTRWGYEIRMTGLNKRFGKYTGMNTTKVILIASILAGAIAGMGGAVEIIGMYDRFKWSALPGLGFDGALIAMLAKNKPKNVIFAALFLAYIRIGADLMARMTDIPSEMVYILQAIIILFISGKKFLEGYKEKSLLKEVKNNE